MSSGVAKKVIGSFEDLAKNVARETAKVPKDVAKTALEGGKKAEKSASIRAFTPGREKTPGPLTNGTFKELDSTSDPKVRASFARRALERLARPKQKELSVREKMEREEEEKKHVEKLQAIDRERQKLPEIKGKSQRGSAFAAKKQAQKKSGMETKVNIKTG